MTGPQRRAASLVQRQGEDFAVGASTRRGVFSNLAPGNARAFLTQGEIDLAVLPLWACLVAHDDATVAGDTVTWNGLSLTVKKVAQARFAGALAAKVLVLAQ